MTHGTLSGYVQQCRCPECREAWRQYHAAYRALKRQRGQCAKCSQPVMAGASRCAKHRQVTLREAA